MQPDKAFQICPPLTAYGDARGLLNIQSEATTAQDQPSLLDEAAAMAQTVARL